MAGIPGAANVVKVQNIAIHRAIAMHVFTVIAAPAAPGPSSGQIWPRKR